MRLVFLSLAVTGAVTLVLWLSCTSPSNPYDKPRNLSYDPNPLALTVNVPMTSVVPTYAGQKVDLFSIDPALPAGLSFDAPTGKISGTPTDTLSSSTFLVTATNAFGSTTCQLTIKIAAPKPEYLRYSYGIVTYTIGSAITENKPSWNGGDPAVFTLDHALPTGLTLNRTTGIISGTPAGAPDTQQYIVTAGNSGGSSQTVLTIMLVAPPPPVNHPPVFVSGIVNRAIKEGDSLIQKIVAHDQDSGNTVTFRFVNFDSLNALFASDSAALRWSSVRDTATIVFSPASRVDNYPFTIRIGDGKDSLQRTFFVTVGNIAAPPQWKPNTITDSVDEGKVFTLAFKGLCTDPQGGTLRYVLADGLPIGDSIMNDSTYRYAPTFNDSGMYQVKIAARNDSMLTDTLFLTLHVRNVDTDSLPPAIRLVDPAADSAVSSADSRVVKVLAVDSSGVERVRFELGADTFPAVRSDSTWSATVTGLTAGAWNTVTVRAWDRSARHNEGRLLVHLKYDPTTTDNTPPTITPISGPSSDTVIRTPYGTITYEIKDASGIDSAYWTLNGVFRGLLQPVAGQTDQYRLTDTLTHYHLNRVSVFAVDKSANHNRQSLNFTLDYNTLPAVVTAVYPKDSVLDVENYGFLFAWHKSTDPDGDTVRYIVMYGSNVNNLAAGYANLDTFFIPSPALGGHTAYAWVVIAVSGRDTVLSPPGGSWVFVTVDHQPAISLLSPVKGQGGIPVMPTMQYKGTDADGDVLSYTIDLDTSKTFGSTRKVTGTTSQSSWTVPLASQLKPGAKYYWRVAVSEIFGSVVGKITMSPPDSFYTVYGGGAPVINRQPVSTLVQYGRSASLSVSATGVPVPTYQWRHNGAPIAGATDSVYNIPFIRAVDNGSYAVDVMNSYGTVASVTVMVLVDFPASTQVARWSFDSTANKTYFDVTGHGFDLIDSGNGQLQLKTGTKGNALECSGTAFSLIVQNSASDFNFRDLTVEAWVKPYSYFPKPGHTLYDHEWIFRYNDQIGASGNTTNGYGIDLNPSGYPYMYISGSTSFPWLQASQTVRQNQWSHLFIVQKGDSSYIYINGAKAVKTGTRLIANTGWNATIAGARTSNWFQGLIDEMAIYNYALSDSIIVNLHGAF